MPTRHSQHLALAAKTAELAMAAPQVVAHRVGRMARAGLLPAARDQEEFLLMGAEKAAAFYESWNAMAWQALRANQAWTQTVWSAMLGGTLPAMSALHAQDAALSLLAHGLAPVHRRAVANAKRLAKIKPR
jgi:hypothetical protein